MWRKRYRVESCTAVSPSSELLPPLPPAVYSSSSLPYLSAAWEADLQGAAGEGSVTEGRWMDYQKRADTHGESTLEVSSILIRKQLLRRRPTAAHTLTCVEPLSHPVTRLIPWARQMPAEARLAGWHLVG